MHKHLVILLSFILLTSGCNLDQPVTCEELSCPSDTICSENAPSQDATCVGCGSLFCPRNTHCEIENGYQLCPYNLSCEELDCPHETLCVPVGGGHHECVPKTCENTECPEPKNCLGVDNGDPICVCPEELIGFDGECYAQQWLCEQENNDELDFRFTSIQINEPRAFSEDPFIQPLFQTLIDIMATQLLVEIDRDTEMMSIQYGQPVIAESPDMIAIEEFCTTETSDNLPAYENIPILIENRRISTVDPIESLDMIIILNTGEIYHRIRIENLEFSDIHFDSLFSVAGDPPWGYRYYPEEEEIYSGSVDGNWRPSGTLSGWITLDDVLSSYSESVLRENYDLCVIFCSVDCEEAQRMPDFTCADGPQPPQEIPELGGALGWRFEADVALGAVTIVE